VLVLEGDYQLHVLRADGASDLRLPPACGGVPIWSPDSRSIACYTGGPLSIDVVDVDGHAAPEPLVHRTSGTGFSWSPDGHRIVYADKTEGRPGLFVVNTGGTPRSTEIELRPQPSGPAEGRLAHGPTFRGPHWSPDGSRIAFQWDDGTGSDEWIYVMRPDGTGVTRVGRGWITGWSPDGRRLAFTRGLRGDALWVTNADGSGPRRLCAADCDGGIWLPDSSKLVYTRQQQVVVADADGSARRVIARTSRPYEGYSLSPDGTTVAYVGGKGRNRNHNLYIVGVDGSGRKLVAHSSTITFWGSSWRPGGGKP
jgi:Tol biopolymer transport system component